MNNIQSLKELGQSVWLDYIQRTLITSGELQSFLDMGICGITSNPSIFEKAITGSTDYDQSIKQMAIEGKTAQGIYDALTLHDIQMAADLLQPIYEQSEGKDGFVSLEVSPKLAYDSDATFIDAQRLWKQVERPNLMIKIPATSEGLSAITKAITAGINVNVTLIFAIQRYQEVMDAYMQGLETRLAAGLPIKNVASVASFFVSRLDTKVDKLLARMTPESNEAVSLLGKAAVANAKIAYAHFTEVLSSDRMQTLIARGGQLQRPLWASTSTKNPNYSDILYVQSLIGRHTVNTIPLNTLEAFLDHGVPELTIEDDLEEARRTIDRLTNLGIDLDTVTKELEEEGVIAFEKSYDNLLLSIENKRLAMIST